MPKIKCDRELVERAVIAFKAWGWHLPTGAAGLTRTELRALWRSGLVSMVSKKLPSGSIINVWYWEGPKK